ncbi:hypothetical protein ACFW17_23555 [Streptomyces sp. NPDC058961]|uniref:hypothetical protein n=1 Tax=Streptomyces sp. NPDC058961 TaxID=3346680 RepID=UPI0036BD5C3D
MTEYPYWDLHDDMWDELEFRFLDLDQETGWNYQSHLSAVPGTKLLGYPGGARTRSGRNASNVGIEWNTC